MALYHKSLNILGTFKIYVIIYCPGKITNFVSRHILHPKDAGKTKNSADPNLSGNLHYLPSLVF